MHAFGVLLIVMGLVTIGAIRIPFAVATIPTPTALPQPRHRVVADPEIHSPGRKPSQREKDNLMDNLLYLLAPIGCAVMMVACMAMMAKGMRRGGDVGDRDAVENDEVDALRAEVAELRAERAAQPTPIDG